MADPHYLLAIDQGTTSTRAILFDNSGRPLFTAQQEIEQFYPADGRVEHDPMEIWQKTLAASRAALAAAPAPERVAAVGLSNQRETTVLWDRGTGTPLHRAIVWQDRRTADLCQQLRRQGHEPAISAATGLLLDPYFSASKLRWLLDHVPGARQRAEAGDLAFGTIDSWLLWQLTGGKVHATDATNASRTLLYNIHRNAWDEELLRLFDIPAAVLPEVRDSAADYGQTAPGLLPRPLSIAGIAGDQQAALIGQACFSPGMVKSTYGTGCFLVLNTGRQVVQSRHRLLSTIAYRLSGETTYALEGSIFVAGAAIQWLRDGLRLISSAGESERLAAGIGGTGGVYLVPAFTGLGAPYWDPQARGAVLGLTRDTGIAEIVRAALESVCYQTHDLMHALADDSGGTIDRLRVDGGMTANGWLLAFMADLLDLPVERPEITETTALGAACLAGLQANLFTSLEDLAERWRRSALFQPSMEAARREQLLQGWRRAVQRVREGGD